MPNIADIIEVAEELEDKPVLAAPRRCVAVRNRNASCRRCLDACLAGAIAIHSNVLAIDYKRCVGCGACATACPTEALIPLAPTDDELASAAAASLERLGGSRAVIACARIASKGLADPHSYAEVPCLGRVDESVLLGLAAAGADDVVLVDGVCKTCKYRATSAGVDETVASANRLAQVQGAPATVRRASAFPEGMPPVDERSLLGESRRGFFTSGASWTAGAAGKTADMVIRKNLGIDEKRQTLREQLGAGDSGTLPQFEERRRTQVLDAMDRLGEPVEPAVETRLFGTVSIDVSKCNSCGMCAVFCPTGALKKSAIVPSPNADGTPDGGSFLEFSCAECVQCGLCVDACMKKCIAVSPVVSTAELFDFEPRFIYLPKPPARPGILSGFPR